MLTIFTIPKPFEGHIGIIQKNAIRSWSRLDPRYEIILFGDEGGTEEAAVEIGAVHCPHVERNEYGTPLVSSLFEAAAREAGHDFLCYLNADIIMMNDFKRAVEIVVGLTSFLMVGRRWDFDMDEELDFTQADWEEKLLVEVQGRARLHPVTGIDYFVFNRNLWGDNIPPFAIGRTAWDNWFIYHAKSTGTPVIDATRSVTAIHQNHGYNPALLERRGEEWLGPEVPRNLSLAGDKAVNYNIADADYILSDGSLAKRKVWMRTRRYLVTNHPVVARSIVWFLRRTKLYPVAMGEENAKR